MPASTYRTVLVGTDGSSTSLRAVDRAAVIVPDGGSPRVCGDVLVVRTTEQSR